MDFPTLRGTREEISKEEQAEKYLTFRSEQQLFGIPVADVVQIVPFQEITEVPDFPVFVKGVISLREEIVPVIDMRLRFQKPEADYTDESCIIVTELEKAYCGFLVDGVDEVLTIAATDIAPPHQLFSETGNTYLEGIARVKDKTILILIAKEMLQQGELELILNQVG